MDRAHHRLARLHRRLGADYDGPLGVPLPKPKWMRQKTYERLTNEIADGEHRLDIAFNVGAARILARIHRREQGKRHWP
jgi:hypothetical protein